MFSAITGIASDDDDDGNAASGNIGNHQPVNYTESLQAAKTLDQLGKVWGTIPKDQQPRFLKVKDDMKAKLTPSQEAA